MECRFVVGSVNVIFQNVVIQETQGIGVAYINVVGMVTFSNVTFINNRPNSSEECYKCLFPFVLNNEQCLYNPASVSGSLLLLYANNRISYPSFDVHVSITQSYFIDNLSCSVANFLTLRQRCFLRYHSLIAMLLQLEALRLYFHRTKILIM